MDKIFEIWCWLFGGAIAFTILYCVICVALAVIGTIIAAGVVVALIVGFFALAAAICGPP